MFLAAQADGVADAARVVEVPQHLVPHADCNLPCMYSVFEMNVDVAGVLDAWMYMQHHLEEHGYGHGHGLYSACIVCLS